MKTLKNSKYSFFIYLGTIIVLSVVFAMGIHSFFSYVETKNRVTNDIKRNSQNTVNTLKDNLAHLISSYAVQEYNYLIFNEIKYGNILAIVVKDYNLEEILGKKSAISGKIRNEKDKIVDFDIENKKHINAIENSYYSHIFDISYKEKTIGKVSIYISDEQIEKELEQILKNNIRATLAISLCLIIVLFFAVRIIVQRPFYEMINKVSNSNEDGIPYEKISQSNFYEMNYLSNSINAMISAIKKSNIKLKSNKNKLEKALLLQKNILDNVGYLLIRTDKNGRIKQVNKEFEELIGYKSEEVVNKYSPLLFHLESEVNKKAAMLSKESNSKAISGFDVFITKTDLEEKKEHEWTFVTKENQLIPVLLNISELKDKNGSIYGYLGIAKNITKEKLFESQSKLASMGEMIGNIAHQWRQPLSVISTIASGIKVKSEFNQLDIDEIAPEMETITQQTKYLSKTIDDFRDFLKDSVQKERIDISTIINKALIIVNSSLKANNITVVLDLEAHNEITAFPNQLIQAIINILNNAKDALKQNIKENQNRLIMIQTQHSNNELSLFIKDNAGGVPKEAIKDIFKPYFSTKQKNKGTGIGLYITHKIITQQHKAKIESYNESFEYENISYYGACFKITFSL